MIQDKKRMVFISFWGQNHWPIHKNASTTRHQNNKRTPKRKPVCLVGFQIVCDDSFCLVHVFVEVGVLSTDAVFGGRILGQFLISMADVDIAAQVSGLVFQLFQAASRPEVHA